MFSRRKCTSAGRVTAHLLLSFLALGASVAGNTAPDTQLVIPIDVSPLPPLIPEPSKRGEHTFTLRHIYHHGTYRHPTLHRKQDVAQSDADVWLAAEDGFEEQRITPLTVRSGPLQIQRLVDRRPNVVDAMVAEARQRGYVSAMSADAWTLDDIAAPDITDKQTVLNLALMAANAYVETPSLPDWEDVSGPFNRSADFGWENDGLRGHVWADENNETVIIGLKGTSMAVFDGDGTTTNDKVNDNLFFSCCCAQQGPWTWHQVCDCATSTYTCNNTCVVQALRDENRYYQAGRELYANVTELYPNSTVWLTGHSLGGAVSSLLGLTYGNPTVTFEAVPEALPAARLGLPVPPGSDPDVPQARDYTGAFHFGHTADPVFVGTCNGATASCSFGGYAMESACHTGRECVYDTVGDKGWRVGIGTHKIRSVIHDVIMKYDTVPECKFTPECRDCGNWKMYESNGTETTTTSKSSTSTSSTRTRTETCKTPGWWGCLDETTTTGTATTTSEVTTTSSTSSTSTTTCATPGWFGCKDKTTTTTSATVTTTTSSTVTTTTAPTATQTSTTTTPSSTCLTPGRFWGCYDGTTSGGSTATTTTTTTTTISSEQSTITPPPSVPAPTSVLPAVSTEEPPRKLSCVERNWAWGCKKWDPLMEDTSDL